MSLELKYKTEHNCDRLNSLVDSIFNNEEISLDLSDSDKNDLCMLVCARLADQLDACPTKDNYPDAFHIVPNFLEKIPYEIYKEAIRSQITVIRLISWDFDTDPIWAQVLRLN